MDYFSYLSITKKEDTKDNFIDYLICLGHEVDKAEELANIYYKEVKNEN
jgi:hypothetical protein